MGPKTPVPEQDFFRQPLREQINLKHPLVRLTELINWDRRGVLMSESFVSGKGRPASSPRLIAGLLYLQHAFDLSDEEVVWQWVENPYWQVFTGETYLQTEPPIDPSSLTRWRKRARRSRRRRVAGRDDRDSKTCRRDQGIEREAGDCRHDGHGEGDCPSNRFAIARAVSRTSGESGRAAWPEAAAELQPRGAASGASDWPLRPREAVQTHEKSAANAAFACWAGDARCGAAGRPGGRLRPQRNCRS
jgi:hypothetical protein